MKASLSPNEMTRARQNRAADPSASAWVSANAGSGKTHVLANRVIRLLLNGAAPSTILCLTFTRAAAAHMSNTVFRRLGAWTALDDAGLAAALRDLGEPADTATMSRARRLFARALDTPGGLKVMTIHAFCERLLHQFPFEARVAAAFEVLDDRQQADLVARARDDVLMAAASAQEGALGRALYTLVAEAGDGSMLRALNDLLRKGEAIERLMRPGGADASARVRDRIEKLLGVSQGETVAAIDAEILDGGIPQARWADIIAWLQRGRKTDAELAACLVAATRAGTTAERRTAYLGLCLTKDLAPRKRFVTEGHQATNTELHALLVRERDRLAALMERRRAAVAAERSFALLVVADAVWTSYRAEKARRGVLDFSDLITATRALLANSGSAWVHYKLDQGIDHVLVDEAQDTSPEQWDIVERLTAEFTAGEGARDAGRTIFAVGDEKQSIFSFQDAAPEKFAEMRSRYRAAHAAAGRPFNEEPLQQSFRTARDILTFIDTVFADPEARRGLHSDDAGTHHDTARGDAPGEVQIWPLVVPDEKEDEDKPWFLPLDATPEKSPVMRHARRLAEAVRGWIEGRDVLGPCAPVPEGQILILVRNRGPLFEAILRELKARNVRVAGADRLDVGKHIAALDLLALADCLLLPDDDLALAGVLKSPLFGFDDDDLIRLAPRRKGSLRRALRESRNEKDRAAHDRLNRLARDALRLRPFDFYAGLIGAGGQRKAYLARLGGEVEDVLDEFLRLAMTYGQSETATLAGFVHWMREAPAEIKRDLETAGGEVRVMTVHGAKGLEAKLVVLADYGAERHGSLAPCLYTPREDRRREDEAELLLWSPRKKDDPEAIRLAREEEKRRDEAEHRRLLYVAMTRAEDRLVICGHITPRMKKEGAWYRLIADALPKLDGVREVATPDGPVLVYGRRPDAGPQAGRPEDARPLPSWLTAPLKPESAAPQPLAPSRALEHIFTGAAADAPALAAKERGTLLHKLMEDLPRFAEAERTQMARRYLAAKLPGISESVRAALADEALALIAHPELAPFMGENSRAEVEIRGIVEQPGYPPREVSGQVDRLIVAPDKVTILDFKSDRPVPSEPPENYVAQLALYRAVLIRVFHGKPVEAALLWTAERRLDPVPQQRLDAALDRVLGMAALS